MFLSRVSWEHLPMTHKSALSSIPSAKWLVTFKGPSFVHGEALNSVSICKWNQKLCLVMIQDFWKNQTCLYLFDVQYSTNSLDVVYPLLWLISCQHQYTSHESQLQRSCSVTSACLRCYPIPHSGRQESYKVCVRSHIRMEGKSSLPPTPPELITLHSNGCFTEVSWSQRGLSKAKPCNL